MRIKRLRAHVRHSLLLLGLACVGLSAASSAVAQATRPQLWEYPGSRPFTGTPLEACQLHEKTTGLPVADCLEGVKLHGLGMCENGFFLQDGYLLHTTLTNRHVSRSVYVQVAFKYPKGHQKAGQPLPADHVKRYAGRCSLNRDDGFTVIYPYVCSNWSVGKEVVPSPERVVTVLPPSVEMEDKCRFVPDGQVVTQGQFIHVEEVTVCDQDISGFTGYLPGSVQTNFRLECE